MRSVENTLKDLFQIDFQTLGKQYSGTKKQGVIHMVRVFILIRTYCVQQIWPAETLSRALLRVPRHL